MTAGESPSRELERAWLAAAGVVTLAAVLVRVHNALVFPPLQDRDGPGHVLNVFALREGQLPSPTSWSGIHPPLYHAAGALLWSLAPESLPVHVVLRWLSAAAGFAAVVVIWRVLLRFVSAADAAGVAAFVLGVPVFAITTSMLGNETTGLLFVTLALARLTQAAQMSRAGSRHALGTALVLFLALLSKATSLLAVAAAVVTYLFHCRHRPRQAVGCAVLVGVVPLALVAPYYLRIVHASGGTPLAFAIGVGLSPDKAMMAAKQPPGERALGDYLYVPIATLLLPTYQAAGMTRSVPGLLYASVWADAHDEFLGPTVTRALLARGPVSSPLLHAQAASAVLGLLPTGLAILGAFRLARRPDPRLLGPLLFGVLLFASLLRYSWILPYYSTVKASYLLPAALPACLALAAGLECFRGRVRGGIRAVLLGLSMLATTLTSYACWH
jgi:hypothetical protein